MGSPLGLVLANIHMVELKKCIIPTLSDHLISWKRYVDDTLAFGKIGMHEYVLDRLNSFEEKLNSHMT